MANHSRLEAKGLHQQLMDPLQRPPPRRQIKKTLAIALTQTPWVKSISGSLIPLPLPLLQTLHLPKVPRQVSLRRHRASQLSSFQVLVLPLLHLLVALALPPATAARAPQQSKPNRRRAQF
ncbi:hypothetical protein EMCG_04311 [[Emmonsia] crescens]|uniref:Uncharacterized protein n=1 Tax=[Emmonsia] crescens TaxID=73230 RepID=A0A0G2HSH1_9EURO|nr:hypothetical protein EMCG_04311 [Emmonsia crescens UAMH 3008]